MGWKDRALLLGAVAVITISAMAQQPAGAISGRVFDATRAVVPGSNLTLTGPDGRSRTAVSGADGSFALRGLEAGRYSIVVTASGFTQTVVGVTVVCGATAILNVQMSVAADKEQVDVTADTQGVGTSLDSNANAVVLKGRDFDVLSDDPDEMLGELQALAGPSAGPNGGQIYVDGFSGGELPPKSAILKIHVNQNPFSAQFERLGYGRIEIITKPGTAGWHSEVGARGNDVAFNSRNPLLLGPQPPYSCYDVTGSLSGPLSHRAAFIVNVISPVHTITEVVSAIDPTSILASHPSGSLQCGVHLPGLPP